MRRAVFFLTVLAALSGFVGKVAANEDEYEHREREEHNSAKFYGIVNALPQNGIAGIWLVNGRQVVVHQGTEVKEKRGKIAVGAYVKIEGYPSGATFTADEIEVKGKRR